MHAERIKFAVVVFVAGIAVISGIVVLVYSFAYLVDILGCFNSATLTAEEVAERRMATGVTIESGLAGLLADERARIYRFFFDALSFPYQADNPTVKSKKRKENDLVCRAGDEDVVDADGSCESSHDLEEQQSEITTHIGNRTRDAASDEKSVTCEDEMASVNGDAEERSAPACSICLIEYETGDKVILGPSCQHMFHYDCCMQWVDKGNGHCPYCRETMITPTEFYESAKNVLGEERVEKLRRINEEAAARVAELTSRGLTSIPFPTPALGNPLATAPTSTLELTSQVPNQVSEQDASNDSSSNTIDDSTLPKEETPPQTTGTEE